MPQKKIAKKKPVRRPTDATMRNVRAANARIKTLTGRVEELESAVGDLRQRFANVESGV